MQRLLQAAAAAAAFVALAWVMPVHGQSGAAPSPRYTPPLTPWGEPDLQGVYTNNDENGIPLERPEAFDGRTLDEVSLAELAELREEREETRVERAPLLGVLPGSNPVHWFEHFGAENSRAWLLVDPPGGRVPPMTEEAQARGGGRGGSSFGNGPFDSTADFSLYDRCITRGVPGSMMPAIYGNAYRIVQAPGTVSIQYEMIHEARVVPLDGRPALSPAIRGYVGDARGRWDGTTLVIETTNFRDGATYRGASAERLRLVERFTPVADGRLEWAVTIDDPSTWTAPWTFAMLLTRGGPEAQPFEYACHEGNYGLPNMLSAARRAEAEAE
jgi:hypothetical protein